MELAAKTLDVAILHRSAWPDQDVANAYAMKALLVNSKLLSPIVDYLIVFRN